MKKFFVQLAASAAVMCGIFAGALSANAATVDDVAAVARQHGYPEEIIQQGYNLYYTNPDAYTSEDYDAAIAKIINGGEQLKAEFFGYIGYTTTAPSNGGTSQTVTTTAPTQGGSQSTTPSSSGNGNSGLSFERISEEEFIKMTYEEKKAYIASLTPEQAQEFMNSLSPEEMKSMMSQLPADKKLEQIDNMSQVGEQLGMNISVDEITDDKLSLQIRDEDGTLVGVAAAGVTVEDTGYDYRLLFSLSGMLIVSAAGGLIFVARKCFGKKNGVGNEN